MGRGLLIAGCLSCLLMFAAQSHSDVATTSPTTTTELPGGGDGNGTGPNLHGHRHGANADPPATPDHPPTTNMPPSQTDPGPAAAVWSYVELTPGEQAYANQAADTTGQDQTNAAFAAAVGQQSTVAASLATANQLGVDNLSSEGVVQ